MKPMVKILSGVSGSGKSTWAQDKGVVFSADHFFLQEGVYRFDPSKLQEAHEACLHDFVCEVQGMEPLEGDADIIVDNTNTTVEEIAPYYAVARAFGYQVELITFHIEWEIAAQRNQHGVPDGAIQTQLQRLRALRIPSFWQIKQRNIRWSEGAGLREF